MAQSCWSPPKSQKNEANLPLSFLLLVKLLDTWCLVQGKSFIPLRPLLKSSHRAGIQQFITSICSTDFWHNCISASLQGLKSEIWKVAFCHWFMCLLNSCLYAGIQTALFAAHIICLMHCVQRPPVLMHHSSKWVTLTMSEKGKNIFSEPKPSLNALVFSLNASQRGCRIRERWKGEEGGDTSCAHLDGSSQVCSFMS